MVGQISMFDIMEEDPIRTPCNRRCEYEWCSIGCFEKRGPVIGNQRRKEHERNLQKLQRMQADLQGRDLREDRKENKADWNL